MENKALIRAIHESLTRIAPEVDPLDLDQGVALRDQVEMDSVDFLRFVLDLERRLGVRIPQADYPKLASLAGCIAYLEKIAPPPGGP